MLPNLLILLRYTTIRHPQAWLRLLHSIDCLRQRTGSFYETYVEGQAVASAPPAMPCSSPPTLRESSSRSKQERGPDACLRCMQAHTRGFAEEERRGSVPWVACRGIKPDRTRTQWQNWSPAERLLVRLFQHAINELRLCLMVRLFPLFPPPLHSLLSNHDLHSHCYWRS